jgi:hypothetical protein
MDIIIEELITQAASRESVSELVKTLKEKYGLKPATIRKVAQAKAKEKLDELLEINSEAIDLVSVLS